MKLSRFLVEKASFSKKTLFVNQILNAMWKVYSTINFKFLIKFRIEKIQNIYQNNLANKRC